MNLDDADALIRRTLEQAWGSTTPLRWPNDKIDPPKDPGSGEPVAFVLYDHDPAEDEQITIGAIGDNVFRDTGSFTLHVCVPAGAGDAPALQLAVQLRAIFRGKDLGGVTCEAASIGGGFDAADSLGNYWRRSVSVEFWTDATA